MRNIILTCVGGVYALETIRALRLDRDIQARIVGVDADPTTPHRHFVDEFFVVPHAGDDSVAFVRELRRIAQETEARIVIAASDEEVSAISLVRAELEDAGLVCPVEEPGTLALLRDKGLLFERLLQLGVRLPLFRLVDSGDEINRASVELGYPERKLILKPRTGRGARGLTILDARAAGPLRETGARGYTIGRLPEVADQATRTPHRFRNMMLMEFLSGPAFDVDCLARQGRVICVVPRQRLWKDPFSPVSQGCRIQRAPAVEALVSSIVGLLNLNHVFDFDVALSESGLPGLMEINPRLSGAAAAGLGGGVNLPALLVRSALDWPVAPPQVIDGIAMFPVTRMVFARTDGSIVESVVVPGNKT